MMAMKLGLLVLLVYSVQVKGNCPDEDNDDGGLPQPSTTSQAYHQQDTTTTATATSGNAYYEEENTFVREDPSSIPVTKLQQRIQSTTSDTHYQTQSEGLLPTTTGRLQPTTKPSTTLSSTSTTTYMLSSTYSGVQLTTQQLTPLSSTSSSSVADVTYVVQATPTPLSQYIVNAAVNSPPECECIVLNDCQAWYDYGYNYSGIFTVNPDDGEPFRVYCDMTTDEGGWTVFQRRQDGSLDFYLGWDQYKQGFGSLTGEYWLGLDKIHRLTKSGDNQLRVDLGDFENNVRYAKYSSFKIGNEATEYTMYISGYSGDAGDTLATHWEVANGSKFTTKDNDNDAASGNCARVYSGAWWYYSCHGSNLNGLYLRGRHSTYANGVEWTTWKGYYYSLRFTEMKIN